MRHPLFGLTVLASIAISDAPQALAVDAVDVLGKALWIEPRGDSVLPLSGTVAGGLALDLHFHSPWSIEFGAALPSNIGAMLGTIRFSAYSLTGKYHFLQTSQVSP